MSVVNGTYAKTVSTLLAGVIVAGILGGIGLHSRMSVAERDIAALEEQHNSQEKEIREKIESIDDRLLQIQLTLQRLMVRQGIASSNPREQ